MPRRCSDLLPTLSYVVVVVLKHYLAIWRLLMHEGLHTPSLPRLHYEYQVPTWLRAPALLLNSNSSHHSSLLHDNSNHASSILSAWVFGPHKPPMRYEGLNQHRPVSSATTSTDTKSSQEAARVKDPHARTPWPLLGVPRCHLAVVATPD